MKLIHALELALYRQQFLLHYYGLTEKGVDKALALQNLVLQNRMIMRTAQYWN